MTTISTWPRTRLKYTCQVNPPAPKVPSEQEVSFVPMEAVGERGGISAGETRPAGLVKQGYTGFRNGDVVVAKITPCFENGKGSIVEGMLGGVGYGSTEFHVIRADHADRGWLFYVTQSRHFMGYGEGSMYGAGGQKRVPPDFIRNYEAWTPPVRTQKAIAAFLDRKTAAIDALIEKKQKLLELLAEKRAALINQAVTKGLDPNVPMKDSGIPWIGAIPAHWEVMRLRHISPKQTVGVVVNPSSYVEDNGDVPFIYGSEVSEGSIDVSQARRISHTSNKLLAKTQLREGDLVSVRVGDPGITAVVPPELDGMNCGSIMIVRRSSSFDSQWLTYAMNSKAGRQNVWLVAYGAAQKQYNIGHAVDFLYPVPPLGEQRLIADWLALSTVKIDRLSTWLEETARRLQEYRQALITAAVTGQVEIR